MAGGEMKRFWSKVDIKGPDECWNWTGAKNNTNYGSFYLEGKLIGAHRMAYMLSNGNIDDKLMVLHSCDNPLCCNPSHLRQGTHVDNVHDTMNKKRYYGSSKTYCPKGHEYTPENTYWNKNKTARQCRICKTERDRQYNKTRSGERKSP